VVNRVYVERAVLGHKRTQGILDRFSRADVVECDRFGEVFNPRAQNFRLQKKNPSLILAAKHERHVLPAPAGYGLDGDRGFYFSHMLNCPYDCRYCFLQGMYSSANYVVFVNYDEFLTAIDQRIAAESEPVWFNAGYDCDSLAFDPVTGFVDFFVPAFAERPQATLELRTKSTQIRSLLKHAASHNVVIAFSFAPQPVHQALEQGVPAIDRRLQAARKLQDAGWPVAIRFEPLVYFAGFEQHYQQLVETVLTTLNSSMLHSVSIGSFRMPDAFFAKARTLYPEEPLFVGAIESRAGVSGYRQQVESELAGFCQARVLEHIDELRFYHCREAS